MTKGRVQIDCTFEASSPIQVDLHLKRVRQVMADLQLPNSEWSIIESTTETHRFDNLSL